MKDIQWKWVVQMLALVLPILLRFLSQEIGDELKQALVGLYKKALKTSSPMDDAIFGSLLDALKIPRP